MSRSSTALSKHERGLLPGPAVCRRYDVSSMTLYRWQRDPDLKLPRPVQINSRNYWYIDELEAWERSRVRESA